MGSNQQDPRAVSFTIFEDWIAPVKNPMNWKLKCLQFDNNGDTIMMSSSNSTDNMASDGSAWLHTIGNRMALLNA